MVTYNQGNFFLPDGSLIPYTEEPRDRAIGEGQELTDFTPSASSSNRDYVARARYLVGNQSQTSEAGTSASSTLEVRRAIAKLERATMELREGILGLSCYLYSNLHHMLITLRF